MWLSGLGVLLACTHFQQTILLYIHRIPAALLLVVLHDYLF